MTKKESAELFSQIKNLFEDSLSPIYQKFAQIDERFAQIDERFAQIDERFAQIDERFAQIDERFERLEKKVDQNYQKLLEKIELNTDLILDLRKEQKSIVEDVISHIISDSDRRMQENQEGIIKIKNVCHNVGKEFVKLAK